MSVDYPSGASNTVVGTMVLPQANNIPFLSRCLQQHETFINVNYQSGIINNNHQSYDLFNMYYVSGVLHT